MGKERLIKRNAFLKQRLYWKKGCIEKNVKFGLNMKHGWKREIWLKVLNLVESVKFGKNCEI